VPKLSTDYQHCLHRIWQGLCNGMVSICLSPIYRPLQQHAVEYSRGTIIAEGPVAKPSTGYRHCLHRMWQGLCNGMVSICLSPIYRPLQQHAVEYSRGMIIAEGPVAKPSTGYRHCLHRMWQGLCPSVCLPVPSIDRCSSMRWVCCWASRG